MIGNIPLTAEQIAIAKRIFGLTVGRVFKKAYVELSEEERKEMEKVFSSDDEKKKTVFLDKHIPKFTEWFTEELTEVEKELNEQLLLQQ